jgi:hypothetical protein
MVPIGTSGYASAAMSNVTGLARLLLLPFIELAGLGDANRMYQAVGAGPVVAPTAQSRPGDRRKGRERHIVSDLVREALAGWMPNQTR